MPLQTQLLKLIQTESALGLKLQDCLISEREPLESQDLVRLQEILGEKAELLTEIEAAREARNEFLTALGLSTDPDKLLNQLKHSDDAVAQTCIEALQACSEIFNISRQHNELNGLLIVNSRKRNLHRLDILRGVHEEQKLYNARGQTARAGSQQSRKLA